ncbi:MAG: tol-pal system protein YbgF [Pseudomonadota bacterium]
MTTHFARKLIVPVCAMTALMGCVKQEDVDRLQQRVAQQEAQLANSQPMQADTWSTVQSMQQEINSLRGQLDDVKFQLENYPKTDDLDAMHSQVARNKAALHRVDSQFALELELDAPSPAFVPMVTPSFGGEPTASGDLTSTASGDLTSTASDYMTSAAPSFNGQTQSTGTDATAQTAPSASANTGMSTGAGTSGASTATGTFVVAGGASGASGTGNPAPAAPQAETAKATDQALYDAGIAAFHERNYESALKSFADFAKIYPTHELTSNAWFWQGECSYQMGKYPEAALAYEQVISKFPKSGKAPSAMMKQGLCFLKMGKKDAAFIRLKDVSKKYPNSPESQRAQQIIKENQ